MPPALLADALAAVRTQLSPAREHEVVPLAAATRGILAGNLLADVDLPAWNSSAVDGFAVRGADLERAEPARLRLAGEAAAGHPFQGCLEAGQAVRILTGARLPRGADLVVMQETRVVEVLLRRDPRLDTRSSRRDDALRSRPHYTVERIFRPVIPD